MVKIESKNVTVNCSAEECFNFLSDMNNYEQILPEKDISEWESTNKSCFFKIKKTYALELIFSHSEPFSAIHIKSGDKSPIKFELDMVLNQIDNACEAQLVCNADINPFLKMIIEQPLKYLFNYMADQLVAVKE